MATHAAGREGGSFWGDTLGDFEGGGEEEYDADAFRPSELEDDEPEWPSTSVEWPDLPGDFWQPSFQGAPDDSEEDGGEGREEEGKDEDNDDAGDAPWPLLASGEENLPASVGPTAQATVAHAPADNLRVAVPAPIAPSRPVGPPLKSAGGTVNKKKTAPRRVIAAEKRADAKLRPFRCTYAGCGYAAAKRRYLLEHERVHSGERPYRCPFPGCTYAASGQGHISRHKRTHTGDRPYPCTHPGCSYRASQSGHLRTHMRTHTGERPFRCPVDGCDYAASRKSHLGRHMKIHGDNAVSASARQKKR